MHTFLSLTIMIRVDAFFSHYSIIRDLTLRALSDPKPLSVTLRLDILFYQGQNTDRLVTKISNNYNYLNYLNNT